MWAVPTSTKIQTVTMYKVVRIAVQFSVNGWNKQKQAREILGATLAPIRHKGFKLHKASTIASCAFSKEQTKFQQNHM